MIDDIVTRLRLRPTILRKNRLGDMETDRAATALFDDCHAIMREAADEIERLREQLRLANIDNFNTTAEIERLRDELVRNADEFRETLTALRHDVETLTRERNNARKWICEIIENPSLVGGLDRPRSKEDVAREQRWDCFG